VIRIAQLSCGSEYSGIQKEIERAAETVGAKIIYPEVSIDDILNVENTFGVSVSSGDLNLAMARAVRIVQNPDLADAVIVMTCFRCAEAAIIRSEIRKYIHEHSKIPVLSYSFTERTTAETLLTRMEALVTTVKYRGLLAREKQTGLTAGIDSGSTTTKSVVMRDNEVIGTGWVPTTEVLKSAEDALQAALKMAGVQKEEVSAVGVTGYGRFLVGKHINARLIQEEITDYYWDFYITSDLIELRNIATVAELIVRCALEREESRGLHYNIDFPQTDDVHWKRDTLIRKEF
jgi:putative methanogenesis marker protein 15